MNSLKELNRHGQSVWLDFLSREFLLEDGLRRLNESDGVSGVTSNPSIFEKAIGESSQYDADIELAVGDGTTGVGMIYEGLAIADIRRAADALRPTYDATNRADGFVSLEVSPYLAMDTDGTIAEARRLWAAVARDNVMIKVPGTTPGLPAIRELSSEGLNINITLLFSQRLYEGVVEAYLSALELRASRGEPIDRIASVASFFVSRIDTAVDKLLDARIAQTQDGAARTKLERLKGKVAVANAKLAYQIYLKAFSGPRWEKLARLGAHPQRLLWASTGTKNPAYSDVLYVEELIGRDTVNTMPIKTIEAFRDHGRVADALTQGVSEAGAVLADLERAGISLDRVTADLAVEGVALFADSFDKLLGAVANKRRRILGAKLNQMSYALGASADGELEKLEDNWRRNGKVRKLWGKDASVWTGRDEASWLGWLDIADRERRTLGPLTEWQRAVGTHGWRDVLLLGMGGSSLGPEVIGRTLGSAKGFPKLRVLDSTNPQEIRAAERAIDLEQTLFIVSSKSGSTLEPNILMDYFFAAVARTVGEQAAGQRFIAITDPGSALQKVAKERRFAQVFLGDPSIGGRYSVLSKFGLAPLAAIGRDVPTFLANAIVMARSCGEEIPPAQNPGVALGLAIGLLAQRGRDKVTIIASPAIADFGAWAEQLIAESTGKNGKALIPIDAEPLAIPSVYGADRLFIYVRDTADFDPAQDHAVDALERASHPVVRIGLAGPSLIGQEFFRFEIAVAVAGAVIGLNPFDQPDVEASKVETRRLTDAYEKAGSLPPETPVFSENGVALFADETNARALKNAGAGNTLASWLRAHYSRVRPSDYVATLAYLERKPATIQALQETRAILLDRKQVATCVEFGPRFLHSTGQAYKGGPNTGVFLQITADDNPDLQIPGRRAHFGVVEAAQARGDFNVMAERGRRLLRAHIGQDVESGLAALNEATKRALI